MRWLVLGCFIALGLCGWTPAYGQPEIVSYTLPNGLQVVLAPDPTVSAAVVHVWYHVGSKDEPAGRTGFAHLFEHLMFEGSAHVKEGQFDRLLEAVGGSNNGTTNNDRTNYFETVPANQLELALYLEADRLHGLWAAMNQSVLDNQRDVVKNERRQSYENRPYGKSYLELPALLWPAGHGYAHSTIGSMTDLSAASLQDVEHFWRQHYRPSNATLLVVGGLDVAHTRALIARYFAWMPNLPRTTTTPLPPLPPRATAAELTLTDKVSAPKVVMGFRTESGLGASVADLQLTAYVLGGSHASRLYRELVVKQGLAASVEAELEPQLGGGEFVIEIVARQGVAAATLRAALDRELSELHRHPPTDAELARARAMLAVSMWRRFEALERRASMLATWQAQTGTAYFAPNQVALWQAATPASVAASIGKWLAPSAAATITVMPTETP